jgi:hypothetical protein
MRLQIELFICPWWRRWLVISAHGGLVEWWVAEETRVMGNYLPQRHFVHRATCPSVEYTWGRTRVSAVRSWLLMAQLMGFLERGIIGLLQGFFYPFYGTTRRNTDLHPCLEWDLKPTNLLNKISVLSLFGLHLRALVLYVVSNVMRYFTV